MAAFMGLYGWWMKPIASPDDHSAFFTAAESRIEEFNQGNTALLLIENGKVVHSHHSMKERGVNENTVFPTASFSKWIAALGVMHLVDQGTIELDAPVSSYLTRWDFPDGPYDEAEVTVRRLLSHTSGLTDELGFGDYAASEKLPSLLETLKNPRASSGNVTHIEVGAEPGEGFAYSGGGYLVLQLLIEDVTGQKYEEFIQNTLLQPLGMNDSSFEFIGVIPTATSSFDVEGQSAPQFKYAAAGATGFVSSSGDLLKLTKAMLGGTAVPGLSPATLEAMRAPEATMLGAGIWGLGVILYAPTQNGDYVYGHDGSNEPAINVSVRINPETDDALIVLMNGHPTLASELGAEWVLWQTGVPDFLSTNTALKSALLPGGIGCIVILILATIMWRRIFSRS